jgi:uncharacterized protein YdaU (DUF1376 family)
MNYYKFHIGDYAKDTPHLSMAEHGAYRLLLDFYYSSGHGIPDDIAHRVCRAVKRSEKNIVDRVLCEFFELGSDGIWRNARCEREISESSKEKPIKPKSENADQMKAQRASRSNAERQRAYRERKRNERNVTDERNASVTPVTENRNESVTEERNESNENVTPRARELTISHKPLANIKTYEPNGSLSKSPISTRNAVTPNVTQKSDDFLDGETQNQNKNQTPEENADEPQTDKIPPCPVEKIVAIYHEKMPRNPDCRVLNPARRRTIAARWREAAKLNTFPFENGITSQADGLEKFSTFFEVCNNSKFLTGRSPQTTPNRPPFFATIDFLMSPSGFAKTLENRYHEEPR